MRQQLLRKGSARCNWDLRKGQQPFRLNPNGFGDRTTTLRRLLIVAGAFGDTAFFLFLLAKAALAFLPTALFVTLRPFFLFQQARYAEVFPLKPTPFCKFFVGLGITNKSAISLFLLSDSCFILTTLSSSIFTFTSISLAGTVFSLLLFYQTTMGPQTLVSPGEQPS